MIFALSSTIGWISHWNEMIGSKYVISRPRQLYTGEKHRKFVSLKSRKAPKSKK